MIHAAQNAWWQNKQSLSEQELKLKNKEISKATELIHDMEMAFAVLN